MNVTLTSQVTDGLRDVTVCSSSSDAGKHRGFAFLEYETHKAAALARKELIASKFSTQPVSRVTMATPSIACCLKKVRYGIKVMIRQI